MTTLTFPLTVDLNQVHFTDEQFYQLCIHNPDLTIERTAAGALIFMSPVGGESGNRELEFGIDLGIWNRQTQRGKVFSSSTIFRLPNGGGAIARCRLGRAVTLAEPHARAAPKISTDRPRLCHGTALSDR